MRSPSLWHTPRLTCKIDLNMAHNDVILAKINHYLYITSQNFKNAIVFQVTFKLVANWGENMISLCSPFFGISWQ